MPTSRISAAILLLAFLAPIALMAQGVNDSVDATRIASLIRTVTSKDRSQIVRLIHYPFGRWNPVSSIDSPADCLKRFDEVFDESLLSDIAHSDPKRDWERVGWRGIMLGNGEVWLDDDYKIIAINHKTEAEKAVRARLISQLKTRLPTSLRDFDEPVLECITPHFLIRVDLKGRDYRLLVFKGHSYKHLLFMKSHGDFQFDGSGGNSHIDWTSRDLSFRLIDDQMGPGAEYTFQEFKGGPNEFGSDDPQPFLEEAGHERTR